MAASTDGSRLGRSLRSQAFPWLTCFLLLTVTLATYATQQGMGDLCSTPWKSFGGYCYFFNESLQKWNASLSACESNTSDLLDIQSVTENAFVAREHMDSIFWIGYNDYSIEGTFVWSRTKESGPYTNWNTGEPNNANEGEQCAVITTRNSTGKWLDVKCNGSYAYVCKKDADECEEDNHGCHANATCTNTFGSYTCKCQAAFAGNGKSCTEIKRLCNDKWTYFEGSCYLFNNETKNWTESQSTCQSKNSSLADIQSARENAFLVQNIPNCLSWLGYNDISDEGIFVWSRTKDHGNYTNWNNGEPNDASEGEDCVALFTENSTGKWLDLPCQNRCKSVCKKDVNECNVGNHDCHANATCTNTFGSFTCTCEDPLIGNGRKCTASMCGKQWIGFEGFCYFVSSGEKTWFDAEINCESHNSHLLDIQSVMENKFITRNINLTHFWIGYNDLHKENTFVWSRPRVNGTYTNWNPGEPNNVPPGEDCGVIEVHKDGNWSDYPCFSSLKFVCKKDLNECSVGNHSCHTSATCTNTMGSYTCSCKASFSGNGKNCTDVNECSVGNHGCHANASCLNTFGSNLCRCKAGFAGNGKVCSDKDECTIWRRYCHANSTCVNTVGNYKCKCTPGFVGDGKNCTDVNECSVGNHSCHANAACVNTFGSNLCRCKAGFSGNGEVCSDIDECASTDHNCSVNATCQNRNGTFSCQCNQTFNGDGVTCTNIIECSSQNHNCSKDATCANKNGSFSCTCNDMYYGDGVTCTKKQNVSSGGSSSPVVYIAVPAVLLVLILAVLLLIYKRKRSSKRSAVVVFPTTLEMLSLPTASDANDETGAAQSQQETHYVPVATSGTFLSSEEATSIVANPANHFNADRQAEGGANVEYEHVTRQSSATAAESDNRYSEPQTVANTSANVRENPSEYTHLSFTTNTDQIAAANDTYDHIDRSADQGTDGKDAKVPDAQSGGTLYSHLSRSGINESHNQMTVPSVDQPGAPTSNDEYAQLQPRKALDG